LNLHQIIQIPKELIDGASDGEADPETMTSIKRMMDNC
jgi:hypothetical protein